MNNTPLKNPTKMLQEMQKRIIFFSKLSRFWNFFEKNIFWKMGISGMKWCSWPSNSCWLFFKIKAKSMLKVSLKMPLKTCKISKIVIFFIFRSISAAVVNTDWAHNPCNLSKNPWKFKIFFVWFHVDPSVRF